MDKISKKEECNMYDAKMKTDDEKKDMRFDCIEDRGYFKKISEENIFNCKSSYIPLDDIIC